MKKDNINRYNSQCKCRVIFNVHIFKTIVLWKLKSENSFQGQVKWIIKVIKLSAAVTKPSVSPWQCPFSSVWIYSGSPDPHVWDFSPSLAFT